MAVLHVSMLVSVCVRACQLKAKVVCCVLTVPQGVAYGVSHMSEKKLREDAHLHNTQLDTKMGDCRHMRKGP